MTGAVITGIGTAVPDRVLSNADLESMMDTNDEWIRERTGIRERRMAGDDDTTASLATAAGAAALKAAGLTPDDIGLCIVATATSEQPVPSTAAIVQDALGLRCGAFDLGAACAGWVYGLVTAAGMLSTGAVDHVLLIGAETISRWIDYTDRGTAILFGDGAGAAVISRPTDADADAGLLAFHLGSDGSAAQYLEVPGGGSRMPTSHETVDAGAHFLKMDGREIFRRAVRAVVDSCQITLEQAGVAASEVDLFVPHQANARIIEAVLPRLGIPAERTVTNIERFGNTSAASVPLALAEAADAGRIAPGDLVLLTGFGAGMAWATALLRWGRATGTPNRATITASTEPPADSQGEPHGS